jgi:glycosyltransferase involved in cell wall biosynthesis
VVEKNIFYGGQPGGTHGWGVCNRHLIEELAKLTSLTPLTEAHPLWRSLALPGDLFTPVGNHEFAAIAPARGKRNFAYTFFEAEPNRRSVENARQFDLMFAGSTWCVERMRAHGIGKGVVLVQGVDGRIFHPQPRMRTDGRFRIFSGGKFELRKGQDLVLRAFKVLQKKYPDMMLVTAWYNHWPQLMSLMARAPGMRFELIKGSWTEQMEHVYRLNGIDPRRVITLPLASQKQMAEVYCESDVGLFPNRCEGGTNLVLMEYMACGRPVIASDGTGHRDVVNGKNSLLLRGLSELVINGPDKIPAACWVEPSVEEIVAQIEFAYHHRVVAETLGRQAAEDMKFWTWERAARTILAHIG